MRHKPGSRAMAPRPARGCRRRRLARSALLSASLSTLLAACSPDPGDPSGDVTGTPEPARHWIELTVGGIPEADRRLLILPPSGFLVDVHFPSPREVLPETLELAFHAWSGEAPRVVRTPVVRHPDGATFLPPDDPGLRPGSHTIWATVERRDGTKESVSLAVAVRTPTERAPLAGGQWIQLDFEADRDRDGIDDFPIDLATFGLASGLSSSADIRVESWVIAEILDRTAAFWVANPSWLPDGDPLAIVFSADPPADGPYTRVCVAGETPGEESYIGNLLLDPGNLDRSDEACDDYLPSGVFPRELVYYESEPAYREAFGPLQQQPVGSHALDYLVLSPAYDASDPAQRERREILTRGVETFAQAVASVVAHEVGHALGLVPPGAPGAGLYGGTEGAAFTHNLTADGTTPEDSLLMNPGPSFGFEDLSGANDTPPPRLRALNFAYLQGRVLLDSRIDGIHPPAVISQVSPNVISSDGPLLEVLEIRGSGFQPAPMVLLRGPADFPVLHIANLSGHDGGPDTLIGQVLAPSLRPGHYALEITNRDGQTTTFENAVEVR